MLTTARLALPVLVLALSASGCFLWTTSDEGDSIVKRIDALEVERAKEHELFEAKMVELEKLIDEASQVLRRNSADQGLLIEQLQQKMRLLEGQLAELGQAGDSTRQQAQAMLSEMSEHRGEVDERERALEARLAALARAAGVDVPVDPTEVPEKKADHFKAATGAVLAGDHSYARGLLREYVTRYESDDKADDALLWLGQSYLAQGQPAAALGELRRVLSTHPKSDVLEDVLWHMGRAFVRLRACDEARNSFKALVGKFPRSTLGKKAAKRLERMGDAKDSCGR